MRRLYSNRRETGYRPRRNGGITRAACHLSIAAMLLSPAGCAQRPLKPAMALRSPSSYNSDEAFLRSQPPPHPLIAVDLPNKPGQKVKVHTVLSVLFPPPPSVRPVPAPPLPPTQLQVQEQPLPITKPAIATRPATQPATTQQTEPPAATEK